MNVSAIAESKTAQILNPVSLPEIPQQLSENIVLASVNDLYNWARLSSIYPLMFGTACCFIEFAAMLGSRFDADRFCKVGRFVGPGSILVTCIAGSLKSIGNVALTDRKVAFNQQINVVFLKKDVHPLFLYGLFLYSKSLVQKKSTSSMKRIITKSKFEEILVFKPPLPLQEKFAQIVQSFERLRAQQRESDRQAEHLFQSILHRAFQGEL